MLKEYIWGTEDWIYQDDAVLIKIIDAKTPLSMQVHPDDEYARLHENGCPGKNEMWYVLEAAPGAYLYCGVKPGEGSEGAALTTAQLRAAAEDGTLEKYLVRYDVKPGDVIYIPAGTIHSIGGGCKILEIQQNSSITYRLYDYKRLGPDGKPRQLHLDKALDVAGLAPSENLVRLPLVTRDFTVSESENCIKTVWKDAAGRERSFVYKKNHL